MREKRNKDLKHVQQVFYGSSDSAFKKVKGTTDHLVDESDVVIGECTGDDADDNEYSQEHPEGTSNE